MPIIVQYRRDPAATWTANDPTLAEGEPGYETDTGKFKVGDGATAWSALAYSSGPAGPTGATGATGAPGADGYSVLSGSGVPTTEGVDGDFYIDTTGPTIYGPKTGGAWGSGTSLIGPSGVADALATAETDTAKVFAPDGAGGVQWRAEAGGSINPYIDATDQSSDPAAPASGAHRIYSKSTGVFVEDSTGTVTGPLGTGGGGALVGGKKQSAGPYTTSSSVMAAVDATNLDITLTTGAHRVLLLFQGVWKQTSTVQNTYFSYRIDSGSFQPHPQDVIYGLSPFNTQGFPISFALLSDALTAGSHTFSLGWATDGPTATLWSVTFQVIEQAF